ncbi:aspartate/glutamate racemase family protein [Variovorax guangxiensis]|uniref:Asp/Glu racemase n=1 Tax=Variovorax guangxiensis TaxID=1775474 RepID=A0A502DYT0_9BURK|nr:aspartate/glutamate racemase family protein [Variovorax guangxiensis]RZI65818.1 MAG: Asp/Glu racemase [Variovorax sp.]TPG25194.1 Asp/Glu racemase [Variovorax ginsengisoli]TPG29441.1 Asp/Glu racemase [Variovorax guangxiensis]
MPRLLVINPNTSASVSALLQHHVQAGVGDAMQVQTITARFGAPYISSEASYAVANHAVLDAWAAHVAQQGRPDAVLIGCFGDPGLFALREGAGVPVGGLAEAAFSESAWHGRFAIVTGGERWRPMLSRLANGLGHGSTLAGIHTVAPTGAQLAADPAGARLLLAEACIEAAERFKAQAVILGGAGLAGMAADIASRVPVPLIDSVHAGAQWALEALRRKDAGAADRGFGVAWQNVSWELTALD